MSPSPPPPMPPAPSQPPPPPAASPLTAACGRRVYLKTFYLLVLVSVCLMAFAAGFIGAVGGRGGEGGGGEWHHHQQQQLQLKSKVEKDDYRGPNRALKVNSAATDVDAPTEPTASFHHHPQHLAQPYVEVPRVRPLRRLRPHGPARVAAGPAGRAFKSIFGFPSLISKKDNLFDFARAHIVERLQKELSSGDETWSRSPLTKKVPPHPLPEEEAKTHDLVAAGDGNGEEGDAPPLRVGQEIPPTRARQILVLTSWRSGSSFFGDLLQHYPGAFYSFEPMHYNMTHVEKEQRLPEHLRLLSNIFKCRVSPSDSSFRSYLQHASSGSNHFLFTHNLRVWNVCQNLLPSKAACFLPKLYVQSCPLFPLRVIKTVRLRLRDARRLLDDPELPNLKVVVLVRDPRPVMASRAAMEWCREGRCGNTTVTCADLEQDVDAARELTKEYPGRITLLRYEDLSLDPYGVKDDLLRFLDLPPADALDKYIQTHTAAKGRPGEEQEGSQTKPRRRNPLTKKNPFGLYRNSKAHAFAWRSRLDLNFLLHVQSLCRRPMDALGYVAVDTAEERDDLEGFRVVTKTRQQVWPEWQKYAENEEEKEEEEMVVPP